MSGECPVNVRFIARNVVRALAGREFHGGHASQLIFSAPYHFHPRNHSGSNWVNQLCLINLYGNLGACSWESIDAGELMCSYSRSSP